MLEIAGYSGLELVHRGQRSLVMRGKRAADGLGVVLKSPAADYPNASDLNRLRHEFQVGRTTEHGPAKASVVHYLDLTAAGTSLALVVEDFGGRSLRHELSSSGLDLQVFVERAVALAAAVHAIHQAGLLHLDINPGNVLFNRSTGQLRLCDLSAALKLDRGATVAPRFRGTLAYASPEQTRRTGRSVDSRADLYSLGITLFELLAGRVPFNGSDTLETFHRHLSAPAPSVRDFRLDVPEVLAQILQKLLSKEPDQRYRSAGGLRTDLERCRAQLTTNKHVTWFEVGKDDRSEHFSVPQRLYGRERELTALKSHFQRSREGETTVAFVAGEAGIGKSTLVEALRELVQRSGGHFCNGKFEPLHKNVPYAAFGAAFRGFLRSALAQPASDLRRWRERLSAAVGPNGKVLIRLVPELERIIGEQPEPPHLEPEQAQTSFRHLLLSLVDHMALPESPLVIFLDDLQWADEASLALLEQLVSTERFGHLMLVCSYRSSEPSANQLVSSLIDRMPRARAPLELSLSPLEPAEVQQIVADTLQSSFDAAGALASVVWSKARGNPFFTAQFLRSLYGAKSLWFDDENAGWRWDLEACESQGATENVLDLMLERMHLLDRRTRQVLRHASCLGREFSLGTLGAVLGMDQEDIEASLAAALDAELLTAVSVLSTDPDAADPKFHFVHDQVQQAAYALIPEDQRATTHLSIGRALLQTYSTEQRSDFLFQLLDHFARAQGLLKLAVERQQIAELCLTAGQRAKSANAYGAAVQHLRTGRTLIGEEGWQTAYALTLALEREYAESCYLAGNFPEMTHSCAEITRRASTLLERIPAYQLELNAHIARNEIPRALVLGAEMLGMLGVKLPLAVSQLGLATRVLRTRLSMRRETAESLLARARVESPEVLCAMQILAQLATPAYLSSPKLFPVVICEMLALTLRHGLSEWSADAFIGWGAIEIAGFGATKRGYAVGSCAPRLVDQLGASARRGRTLTTYNLLIRHWQEPLKNTLEPLSTAVHSAVAHGDLSFASAAAVTHSFYMMASGRPLAEIEEIALAYDKLLSPLGQERYRRDARRMLQLIRCLQGKAPEPKRLRGEFFDETEALRQSLETGDRAAIAALCYERALLLFVYSDHRAALECCELSAQHVDSLLGTVYPPALELLSALVRARLLRDVRSSGERGKHLGAMRRSLTKLKGWARAVPENHEHRVHLIEAELAAIRGNFEEAVNKFERAIETARRRGYVNELAMALEGAGRFYVAQRQERVAAATLRAARDAWLSWGASAKAAQLEKELAELFMAYGAPPALPSGNTSHAERTLELMDVASVIKASQAIVSEIRVPGLLKRLLRLAMENTGAQRGFLFLNQASQLVLQAAADVDDERAGGEGLHPPDAEDALRPHGIAQYVARIGEPLLEDDLTAQALFEQDPYVRRYRPMSVLCVPLVSHGSLGGVIYLENNRLRGAFNGERLQVVRLLAALSAISLENARLYEDVERAHLLQVRVSDAQARFVPVEFLRNLGRDSIVDVRLGDNVRKEMSVLFSDVRGFTSLVESMPVEEHIEFINAYLGHMEPAIAEAGGFVDSYSGDGIMALFEGDADKAIHSAIRMSKNLAGFNQARSQRGLASVAMGIGVSTGPMTLGTIGGPGRIKCGVIGDAVNLASRIEALTKRFGCFLLISEHSRRALREPQLFDLRMVDRVRVLGRTEPIALFEVLDAELPEIADAKRRTHLRFEQGLEAYTHGRFREATGLFEQCLRDCPRDGAALSLIARSRQYASQPPDGWDGITSLSEK
jgi:predicted ATPase/class 3 adenylate cyclase